MKQAILGALRQHLRARASRHDLTILPDASQADLIAAALHVLSQAAQAQLWPLIAEMRIAAGNLNITLDAAAIAASTGVNITALTPDSTHLEQPFQRRRRGVETRIVTSTRIPQPDPVLQQNLARAHRWAEQIKAGKALTDIATSQGHAETYIRTRLALAFLAPPIHGAILNGTIGPEWTTDRIVQARLPLDWAGQMQRIGL